MPIEARVILVLFQKNIGTQAIEKLLNDFGPSFLQWTKAFEESENIYAVQVVAPQAVEWKNALAQLPEVAWTECISSVRFSRCSEA